MALNIQLVNFISKVKLDKFLLTDDKKLNHENLSRVSQWLLLIAIVWSLSQLTWQLLTPTQNVKPLIQTSGSQSSSSANRVNLSDILALNLFGKYSAQKEEPKQVEVAPVTSLNLKLMGVVSSSEPSLAAAIIEKSGSQSTYGVGEKIDGTQAVIREVYPDRVILEQRGKRETLMLEGADYTVTASVGAPAKEKKEIDRNKVKKNKRKLNTNQRQRVEEMKQEFFADPGKVSDYIKASPFKRDGELVGYKIRPGKKVELFNTFGLRNGDIAVEINGYDLTDLTQAMTAMQELRNATEARLLVERNGEIIETQFSLN